MRRGGEGRVIAFALPVAVLEYICRGGRLLRALRLMVARAKHEAPELKSRRLKDIGFAVRGELAFVRLYFDRSGDEA